MPKNQRHNILGAVASSLLLAGQADSAELEKLSKDYWEAVLKFNPTYATFLGDKRYNDRLEDIGPKGRRLWLKEIERFERRAAKIKEDTLSEPERVTLDILRQKLSFEREEMVHKTYQWAVDQLNGPQVWLADLMNFTPLDTEKDVQDLIARFQAFGQYLQQHIDNLREGIQEKRTAPRISVERVISQLEDIAAQTPQDSPFGKKTASMKKELTAQYKDKVLAAVRDSVLPAFEKYRGFLKNEYIQHAREENVGLGALPGGDEAYRFRIRYHTTTDKTAAELHEMGLQELENIHKEMRQIAQSMGHSGDLASFFKKVKADKANYFKQRDELYDTAVREVQRAYEKLPAFFGRLPKVLCEVKRMEPHQEENAPMAYYYQPDNHLTRKGIYYINTYQPESKTRYEMTALAVHEAVPGHHLQIALALENRNLPEFRRNTAFTAFTEGWGLYAERLAMEMGLYETPMSRFGMLQYQAWRACRLVVDTGLHAMGWTRQKAIEFMASNTPVSRAEVEIEVDRYIIMPGQALAYMVGMKEIQAIRKQAEVALGERFDIREFHDVLLANGSIPLSTLRQVISRWVEAKKT